MNTGKDNSGNKITSGIVENSKPEAEDYLEDPEKAHQLLSAADAKANAKEKSRGQLSNVWEYLRAMLRLLRSYLHREYNTIPWKSIVFIVAAIIYFVAIVDLLPDFIPGIGYIDDAGVIAFVISQVKIDLDKYIQWETKNEIEK
jgi:uncharacterized membrane protein YkvA (DUF1232 family)